MQRGGFERVRNMLGVASHGFNAINNGNTVIPCSFLVKHNRVDEDNGHGYWSLIFRIPGHWLG